MRRGVYSISQNSACVILGWRYSLVRVQRQKEQTLLSGFIQSTLILCIARTMAFALFTVFKYIVGR